MDEDVTVTQITGKAKTALAVRDNPQSKPEEVLKTRQDFFTSGASAVNANPQSEKIPIAVAQGALKLGDTRSAEHMADVGVTRAEQKQNPQELVDALKTRAIAEAVAGDMAKAHADAARALKLDPKDDTAAMLENVTASHVKPRQFQIDNFDDKSGAAGGVPSAELVQLIDKVSQPRYTRPAGFAGSVGDAKQAAVDGKLADYQAMFDKATDAIKKLPDNPNAYLQRSAAATLLGDTKQAIADATTGLKLKPGNAALLSARAAAYNASGDAQRALADAQAAVAANPKAADAWLQQAAAREKLGQPSEQYLDDYKKAAELDPALAPELQAALARAAQKDLKLEPGTNLSLGGGGWSAGRKAYAGGVAVAALMVLGIILFLRGGKKPSPASAFAALDLKAGAVVGGNYEIKGVVGEGGMGVVYEAWDRTLKRKVALKRMGAAVRDDATERKRFLDEALTMARFKDPRLVTIYTAIEDGGEVFLVCELVEGETVLQRLERFGRLTPKESLTILEDVCGGLDYAHERGVIHRDLKPANIMIENGRAKLMDFGIARWTQNPNLRTQTVNYIGTPAFMAPEQSFGDVSRESDLYALGVTVFSMLTGRLPFEGPQAGQDKLEGRFDAAALGQNAALEGFFKRALDPRAENRFRSGRDLLEAFRQAAASLV